MRKLLAFLTAVTISAVLALPASAGWNIKQNADGTADWVNGFGDKSTIGAIYLHAFVTDVSTAQTIAVVVPITAVKVTYIESVMGGDITTADVAVAFSRSRDLDGTIVDEISNGTGRMAITAVAGDELGDVDVFTPTKTNAMQKDGVIYIWVDGGSTNTVGARFTITLKPYR